MKLAKDKPGTLNYASAGIGSPAHLAGEMLNLLAGIRLTHVPYKGAAPALLDVIAGNAQLIITSPIAAGGHMSERPRARARHHRRRAQSGAARSAHRRRDGARLRNHPIVGRRRAGRDAGRRSCAASATRSSR